MPNGCILGQGNGGGGNGGGGTGSGGGGGGGIQPCKAKEINKDTSIKPVVIIFFKLPILLFLPLRNREPSQQELQICQNVSRVPRTI